MKRIIIVVLVLVVVASGGAAGLVMLGVIHNPFQKPGADAVAMAAAEAEAAAAAANGFKPPTEVLQLVKMPDMVIPVIHNGQVTRRVSVSLGLVTKTVEKAHILAQLPQFQNDFLADLVAYFPTHFEHQDIIDVDAVKEKARKHAAHVFGDAVSDVLLINVFEAGSQAAPAANLGSSDD